MNDQEARDEREFEVHLRSLHSGGWDRKASIPGRNAEAEFDRWLAARDARILAAAGKTPEPEWEYGCANFGDTDDVITVPGPLALQGKSERAWAEGVLQPEYGDLLVRRVKAGPWEAVDGAR